jgi:hypothetical protein
MPPPKAVRVTWFEVPTESVLPGRPEHKIQHGFTADRVHCHAVFCSMNSLAANSQHELRFFRERPRHLEQKVGVPFCRVTSKKWRNSELKFQPVLYRCHFSRDGGAEARSAVCDTPVSSSPIGNHWIGPQNPIGRTEEKQTAAPLSTGEQPSETAAPVSEQPVTGHGSTEEASRLAMVAKWIGFKWFYRIHSKGV